MKKNFLIVFLITMFVLFTAGCSIDDFDEDSNKPNIQNSTPSKEPLEKKKNKPDSTKNKSEQKIEKYTYVKTDTQVKVDDTVYPNTYVYKYEGIKDGKEIFSYFYRWKSGKEYTNGDLVFSCTSPPESIPAGGKISMTITYQMTGFSGWTYDGTYTVPASPAYVTTAGRQCKNAKGETDLWPGNRNTNYLMGDFKEKDTFVGYVPDNKTAGDEININFTCSAGSIKWIYKLTKG